jgi:uncharacterized protein (TIGR03437 family)
VKLCLPLLFLMASSIPAATTQFTNWIAGGNQYKVARIATDAAGDTFIAGTRTLPISSDIFIVKLDPSGNVVLYREISGDGSDQASDMAIDPAGDIYVAGSTTSLYFPLSNAMQTTPGPGFLFKMSADGSQFLWSTYYREQIAGLAVDSSGSVYITGSTTDPTYPVTPGLPAGSSSLGPSALAGAFLTKISAAGSSIVYSAVIVGSGHTCGAGSSCSFSEIYASGAAVAVDAAGDAFFAGNTNAASLPTTSGAVVPTGTGAFVGSIKADGSAMTYLTFIGSANEATGEAVTFAGNIATAIAADSAGNAYVTGSTFDTMFPATAGVYQTTYGGPVPSNVFFNPPTDAFVLKLNPTGKSIVWASYLGGSGVDSANSIAVDSTGQVWIAGTTASTGFPNPNGFIAGSDFVSGFSASGAQLVYSARFPNDGASRGIAVDPTGFLHIAGPTGTVSALSPTSAPIPEIFGIANAANGPLDARVARGEAISIYGPHIGPSTPVIATADSTGNLPTQLAGYQVSTGGTPLPLLYVSDSQINAITTSPTNAAFTVIAPTTTTPNFTGAQVTSRPEIFHNTDNSAIAVNQDGTFNSQSNPAHFGTYEAIWMTGSGVLLGVSPGQIATGANDLHCCSVLLDGTPETAVYGGYSPGVALGVLQVNFLVNMTTAIGSQPTAANLLVTGIDGTMSHPVTLWIAH